MWPSKDEVEERPPAERGRLIEADIILTMAGERVPTFWGCDLAYLESLGVTIGSFVSFDWVSGNRHAENIRAVEPTPQERATLLLPERPPAAPVDAGAQAADAAFMDDFFARGARGELGGARPAAAAPREESPEARARYMEHYAQGNLFMFKREYAAAHAEFLRALELRPGDPHALARIEKMKQAGVL